VRRNRKRFPDDGLFELTTEEFANLKSHFATSSWGGRRKLPRAFTEHGGRHYRAAYAGASRRRLAYRAPLCRCPPDPTWY
jgi:hypothetical protein